MKKKIIKFTLLIFLLFLIGNLTAKYILGLGETPVYLADNSFEYIYAPDQNISRFGNNILTNIYSMRSLSLNKNEKRILVFGDSILNGGSLTTHENLATSISEKYMQKNNYDIRILNISAGSWGVDNAFAYLKEYGDFNASAIILLFSSHDAYDNMNFEKVVDVHKNYPKTQPCCALWDGFDRYFLPKINTLFNEAKSFSKINKIDHSDMFNTGWLSFVAYSKKKNTPLFVILHPDKIELSEGKYNKNGEKIISFLKEKNIPYLLELGNEEIKNYRDQIHYNDKGQVFLSRELITIVEKLIIMEKK